MQVRDHPAFHRQTLLSGAILLERLRNTRVMLFGIGGVGSWCAESLIRTGIGHLTIVDSDLVCVTNLNRQLHATLETVGCAKTEVMAKRLQSINPEAEIVAMQEVFNYKTAAGFALPGYDYVVDAIDSLSPKVDLIEAVLNSETTLFSSMGASCKIDPTRIKVGSFWGDVVGCPLAKKVRRRLRRRRVSKDFLCVFSDELLIAFDGEGCGTGECVCPKLDKENPGRPVHEWCSAKKQINGSTVHITAPFGFFLSWLVYRDVMEKCGQRPAERGRESGVGDRPGLNKE